jgi:hypothetical protein
MGHPVDDGHGHMIRSGTHAQVFTTPISRAMSTPQTDSEIHQGRIASALNVDRVRKILDFDGVSASPQTPQGLHGRLTEVEPKTKWNGVEWVSAKENEGIVAEEIQGLLIDGIDRRSITETYKLSGFTGTPV